MKKTLLLLSSVFLLTACSSNDTPTVASSNESSSSVVESTVESSSAVVESTPGTSESTSTNQVDDSNSIWNQDKASKLAQFMEKFDSEQPYKSYTPTNNLDYAGVELPKEVLVETKTTWNPVISVGEEVTPIALHWYEEDAKYPAEDYQIVSLYSNGTRENWPNYHIYAFAVKDGKPVVLHTAQTQGNPDNYFYFTPSDNQEINQEFENIINQ